MRREDVAPKVWARHVDLLVLQIIHDSDSPISTPDMCQAMYDAGHRWAGDETGWHAVHRAVIRLTRRQEVRNLKGRGSTAGYIVTDKGRESLQAAPSASAAG